MTNITHLIAHEETILPKPDTLTLSNNKVPDSMPRYVWVRALK